MTTLHEQVAERISQSMPGLTLDDRELADGGLKLALAFALGLPLGWQRETSRGPDLRTYPLLSTCVCGFLVVAQHAAADPGDLADVFFGVLTGIGFVGSGAIIETPAHHAGLSTAVSLWVTGAIGVAVALGAAPIAVAVSLTSALALLSLARPSAKKETS